MLLILAVAVASILAQTCSTGTNQPGFSECVFTYLTDPTGQPGPSDMFQACTSLQNNQGAYFTCLCEKSRAMINCYNLFCAGKFKLESMMK